MADGGTKKRSWTKIFFLIPGVLILSALPLLIFRPVKQDEPVRKTQERFTFMTSTPLTEKDQHDLAYWEKAGNPELFAKPDAKFGYPAFLNPEMKDLKPGKSDLQALPRRPGGFAPAKLMLHDMRSPEDLLVQIRIPLDHVFRTEKIKSIFVKAPVFLLENGEIFPVPDFKQPESNVKDLMPTILSVRKPAENAPPEISVERSCGDSQLDNAAMRTLYFHAAINKKVKGVIRVEWSNEDAK